MYFGYVSDASIETGQLLIDDSCELAVLDQQ